MVEAICVVALIAWVADQTHKDVREIWRTRNQRRVGGEE
jgi:hypothetical protein